MGTMCVLSKTLYHLQNINGDILVFHRKRLEPRVLPWQQHSRYHFLPFAMYISGAKREHCSKISGDILDSLSYCLSGTIYDVIAFLIAAPCYTGGHKD